MWQARINYSTEKTNNFILTIFTADSTMKREYMKRRESMKRNNNVLHFVKYKWPSLDSNVWKRFCTICHQNGIVPEIIEIQDESDFCGMLSDPFVINWNFSHPFFGQIDHLLPMHRSILLTEGVEPSSRRMSTVSPDLAQIAREVISYLSEAGREKIALFAFDFYLKKHKVFSKEAEQIGCIIREEDVFLNDVNQISDCFARLLSRIDKYNAVICANDMAALYLITELAKFGIRVPEDVFVVAQGNSLVTQSTVPSITSIDLLSEQQVEQCIALWKHLKRNPDIIRAQITIGHRLVVGESTAGFEQKDKWRDKPLYTYNEIEERGYGELVKLKNFLKNTDEVDRKILHAIAENKKYEDIGAENFMTAGAIKYRMRKMLQSFGANDRQELLSVLQKYNIKL
ncbi:MAG: hypothetical protein E7408_02045 [Ruminococcaceae bacterium]|nr:hypothetical protein [Oscillospiraceae bacterium]